MMGIDRTDLGAGVVEGDENANNIDLAYTGDPEGDRIDNGDAILPGQGPNDDIVNAGAGDDTVMAGEGDDEVFGGAGNDYIDGGPGNDLLMGDRDIANNQPGVRESFQWNLAPDPDGDDGTPGIDSGDRLDGFTQNTGNVDVTFSLTESKNVGSFFADNFHNVNDIVTDGSPADPNSALDSVLGGAGREASYSLDFSNPVENVSFRINDIDGDGIVKVMAFDAEGNPITVNLTGGSKLTLLDTDTVAGADTADSDGGYGEDVDPDYSVLVDIPGPVSQITVVHSQDGPDNSGIKVTDVFFDTTPPEMAEGDDTLIGGEGDDTLYGDGGNDVLIGGPGADMIYGGDGADTIIGGTDGDVVDGGSGGDDNDTLDLSGSGPLRVVGQTDDPDGNSTSGTVEFLDLDGNVNGSMTFTEIENLILPDANAAPVTMADSATTVRGEAVNIPVLANDSDPEGDTLRVTAATDGTNGTVTVNADNTVTYTPTGDFTGDDSFTYTVSDGNGNAVTETVTVSVTPPAPGLDGIVQGTDGDDLIDYDYTGDPHGDRIDHNDEILPGQGPNDDIVEAGVGNDTVYAGEGNDDVRGGPGDDLLDGGVGNDTIDGGPGDDTILGGDGDDVLIGGEGDDLIFGQDGDDTIDGGPGNDTLDGGAGDDVISGGEGDDLIVGGTGNDTLAGGPGNDTVDGGEGDDLVAGGDGDDELIGGTGNDTLLGEAGNDTILGGTGDDLIIGGDGDDVLLGEAGNDTIIGGPGADTMYGGAGRDTFVIGSAGDANGDVADGGSGGDDYDTLDLGGAGRYEIIDETTDPDGNSTSGTINFLDGDDNVTGSMIFREIEKIIPCFTPGTVIATPQGERLVEDLQVGDRVITRDNGLQEIRWLGRRDLEGRELLQAPHLRPVLIRAGALGRGLPERDLLVSPNHRVLINNEKTALYFEDREVLAAAKHLTGLEGVDAVDTVAVSYIHFMFDQHEVVLSNGSWTESFQPGEQTLDGMGAESRDEIYSLFPELRDLEGIDAYQAARRSLRKHEARLLTR